MTSKPKAQAELEIESLQDVFNIATTGFDEFYKTAKKKASGFSSTAASSGDYSTAVSSGASSKAGSSGDYSTAASSGFSSTAASSGASSKAGSSGDYSTAECSGKHSGCTSIGYRATVKGDLGNLLMASEYIKKDNELIPIGGKAAIVDGKILKPNCWYIVENGEWVEVDFTDGVFSYVLSNKNGVKRVKTEQGNVLYIVSDGKGNYAHGKTIAKAREDLIYKAIERSDVDIPEKATGKEWVGIYRAVTGACSAGVKNFVEQTGKSLDDEYTAKEIAKLVAGQFGAEQFAKKIEGKI